MINEHQLTRPILKVLDGSSLGELPTTELRQELRRRLPLASEDLEPLRGRSDQRIDQIIRNVKSHKRVPGNPFADGLLRDVPRGFRITEKGRAIIER